MEIFLLMEIVSIWSAYSCLCCIVARIFYVSHKLRVTIAAVCFQKFIHYYYWFKFLHCFFALSCSQFSFSFTLFSLWDVQARYSFTYGLGESDGDRVCEVIILWFCFTWLSPINEDWEQQCISGWVSKWLFFIFIEWLGPD
jgi:hypothetical protein